MHIVPDSGEIIKFDAEGRSGVAMYWGMVQVFLRSHWYYLVLILLVGIVSFELGLMANIASKKLPVTITEPPEITADTSNTDNALVPTPGVKAIQGGEVVASRTGKKYSYPWCGTASRISAANRIAFASVADARSKGYTPAANCKGLQ